MKKYLRTSLVLSGLMLFFPLAGCSNAPAAVVDNNAVSSVFLDKTNINLTVGLQTTLYATILPSTAVDQNVYWTTSNEDIASVNNRGVVTANSVGTATITVHTHDGEKTASCTVNVVAGSIAVTGVSLNYETLNIYKEKSLTLIPTIEPYNATILTLLGVVQTMPLSPLVNLEQLLV